MYEKFPIAFDIITLQTKEKLKFGGNSMNAFEKVIGYETVKNELMQICDMVHNKERYEALGARMPKGGAYSRRTVQHKKAVSVCFGIKIIVKYFLRF